jgi:preprotein translocase subunit SecG
MFHDILVVFHVFLCVGLIGLILIQHGKGADAGAAFGSGASSTVFGSQGSGNFLSRTTGILATLFFLTSLTLAYFSVQHIEQPKSVVETVQPAPTSESETPSVPSENNSDMPPVQTSPNADKDSEVPNPVTDK